MAAKDRFPAGASKSPKDYVYRLVDPRNGSTFYEGMGSGNQVFVLAKDYFADKRIPDVYRRRGTINPAQYSQQPE